MSEDVFPSLIFALELDEGESHAVGKGKLQDPFPVHMGRNLTLKRQPLWVIGLIAGEQGVCFPNTNLESFGRPVPDRFPLGSLRAEDGGVRERAMKALFQDDPSHSAASREAPTEFPEQAPDSPEAQIDRWLASFGLAFDPFRVLDAAADPRLSQYLVGHQVLEILWGDWPSLVFASAGGGKSAFRVWLAHACRAGWDGRHIFPIVYALPERVMQAAPPDRQRSYQETILEAAARELLLTLAYRPERYLDLPPSQRRRLASWLAHTLPTPPIHLLAPVQTAQDLSVLGEGYDPTFTMANPPTARRLQQLKAVLTDVLSTGPSSQPDADSRWQSLHELLTDLLGYRAVYLLLDGVDAYPETLNRPDRIAEVLAPLLHLLRQWNDQALGAFLKAFLPQEARPWQERVEGLLTPEPRVAMINWNRSSLLTLLRQRLLAASQGRFDRLGALGDPGLYDADERLVDEVRPYPRELLLVAERLFLEHILRAGPEGRLSSEDLEAALAWYARQPAGDRGLAEAGGKQDVSKGTSS